MPSRLEIALPFVIPSEDATGSPTRNLLLPLGLRSEDLPERCLPDTGSRTFCHPLCFTGQRRATEHCL